MRGTVLLIWACCLWSIAREVCCLLWTASPWRRVLTLAILALAAANCHKPREGHAP